MTARDDIRILPSAALTVTLIALVAFVVQYHRAAMWACVVALVLAVGALFTVAIEAGREKARADDAEQRAGDLADELGVLLPEVETLRSRLADATPVPLVQPEQLAPVRIHPGGPRPDLSIVPTQREPEHDHLAADDDWFARLYDDKGNLR